MKRILPLTIVLIGLTACTMLQPKPTPTPAPTELPEANMPNPASVYCEQQGNRLEIRTAADGSQSGVCIFPDGSECDEWAYFRGECGPGIPSDTTPASTGEVASDGCNVFRNEGLGYSFHYPADGQITVNEEPSLGLSIVGPGGAWPLITISHPRDREEFRPPEGANLVEWLTDHSLWGETRMPDAQIAGTTAIHFRHERSPQSYADDRYYFTKADQLYLIIIGHVDDKEDWEFYNHFLSSIQFDQQASDTPAKAAIPTALPIDPADYQGWWTYTHSIYGFSIMLPEDWIVEETTTFDPLMNGHMLNLHPSYAAGMESIRMTFRRVGEDVLLWPTGVGQGEFVPQGTLDIAGLPAQRLLLVCPTGDVTAIWYHQGEGQPNITRGGLEFGFIYSTAGHCEAGNSLGGKVQRVGEMIIASLKVP